VLVNPVNCAGVMGKGLALEFKLRYPAMYICCRMACLEQELKPGGLLVWRSCTGSVVSLATKDDWRAPSSYAWVAACLAALRDLSCPVSGGYVALPTFRCLDWGSLQQDSRVCSPVLSYFLSSALQWPYKASGQARSKTPWRRAAAPPQPGS
jgi:hypothetical protein